MSEMSSQHKPLTAAEIVERAVNFLETEARPGGPAQAHANALRKAVSMLTPPTDAALREAMAYVEKALAAPSAFGGADAATYIRDDVLRTLLSYVRAVQSPRLTGEQREAVKEAYARLMAYACPNDEDAGESLRSAFPEAFEKVVG